MSKPDKKTSKPASSDEESQVGAEQGSEGDADEYQVGYRKPPKNTQFKKGNTHGKGRRRGSKNLATMVREIFEIREPAKLGDKTVKLNTLEMGLHQTRQGVKRGKDKSIDRAFALYERLGPQEDANGPPPEKVKRDWRAYRKFMEMKQFIEPDDDDGEEGDA